MRALAVVLMLLGIASLGASSYVEALYARSRPRAPDQFIGRIYPLNVHGTVVYLTRGEDQLQFWSFAGGLLVAIGGGALFQRYYPRQRRGA